MRAIVTGGAGFVGSHLVDKLLEANHEVFIIDNLVTGKKENVNPKATFWKGSVQKFCKKDINLQFDVIYHLAALARIQPSFKECWRTYEENSTGTIAALEMARYFRCPLVYAGSSSICHDPFANPYSYTKWLGEQHCRLYDELYEIPTAIARFYNVYGPRQLQVGPYATMMGIFERQYANGESLTITGDGEQRRDLCHVSDIVNALVLIGAEAWRKTTFNLGTGKNYSVNEVAAMFGSKVTYVPARPGEDRETKADNKFAKKMLGWKPQVSLKDYIAKIVGKKRYVK